MSAEQKLAPAIEGRGRGKDLKCKCSNAWLNCPGPNKMFLLNKLGHPKRFPRSIVFHKGDCPLTAFETPKQSERLTHIDCVETLEFSSYEPFLLFQPTGLSGLAWSFLKSRISLCNAQKTHLGQGETYATSLENERPKHSESPRELAFLCIHPGNPPATLRHPRLILKLPIFISRGSSFQTPALASFLNFSKRNSNCSFPFQGPFQGNQVVFVNATPKPWPKRQNPAGTSMRIQKSKLRDVYFQFSTAVRSPAFWEANPRTEPTVRCTEGSVQTHLPEGATRTPRPLPIKTENHPGQPSSAFVCAQNATLPHLLQGPWSWGRL